ncbi:MAG: Dps family protein [Sarcina sp.]
MKLEKELNVYLSNQSVMHMKLHNLHWFVTGEGFFTAHAKLEELYNIAAGLVDDIAELLLSNGMKPVASLKEQLGLATVKELGDKKISSKEAMKVVLGDYELLRADSAKILELAEKENKQSIVDMINGHIAQYDKSIWMLNAYLA